MANKSIVYAIYPNLIQDEQCQKTFGCCRFVYNQMLTVQQNRHKANEKYLSKYLLTHTVIKILKQTIHF